MKLKVILTIAASLLCFSALAQMRDVGVQVGVNVPMTRKFGVGSDITFGVGYGQFFHNGLGFRTGIQYSASVAGIDDAFGIPLAFAYRTHSRSAGERLRAGAAGAGDVLSNGTYSGGSGTARGFLGGFLLNLFSDMEFFAGVTPGYVAGASGSPKKLSWDSRYQEDIRVDKDSSFSLTLDAGMSLNYSIWRFDLKLIPAIHFNPTDNYIYHVTASDNGVKTKESTSPLRWFFTLNGGLAFRF